MEDALVMIEKIIEEHKQILERVLGFEAGD